MTIRSRRCFWAGGGRHGYWASCRRCWWWTRAASLPEVFAAAMQHLDEFRTRKSTKED